MKKINILMIGSDTSVKGGIVSVVEQLLSFNWNSNIKITYLASHIDGSKIKKITFFINSLIKLIKNLMFEKIDIVHIHMSYNGSFSRKYIICRICELFRKKFIIHLHGSEFKDFYERINEKKKLKVNWMFEKASIVLVLGENWKKYILYIVPKANVEILVNSVNVISYKSNLNNERFNILFLGALIKRKGIYDLIEVIKLLKEDSLLDKYNVCFFIGGSGIEEIKFKQLINKYELNEYVEMLGWVDKKTKIDLLKKSHLFVLPSYNEGLPVAILEAMNFGLPIISTRVGSINEAVIDNYNGILISPGNKNELKYAIEKIILDKKIWDKYSENSKKNIIEKFDEKINFFKLNKKYIDIALNSKEVN